MELNKVQSAMLNYFGTNKWFGLLLPFASVMVLLHGGYSVLIEISFINFIMRFVSNISAVLYVLYVLGCILAFAKNDMKTLVIGFGLEAVGEILNLITYGYKYNLLNCIVYIIFYICLTYFSMVRFNKSGGETS